MLTHRNLFFNNLKKLLKIVKIIKNKNYKNQTYKPAQK